MKRWSEMRRFYIAATILVFAFLFLAISPYSSPQAYFVLALGAIPVMGIGVRKLQKAKK